MPRTLEEVIAALPAEQRARIEARTAEIVALHMLRKTVGKTQSEVAQTLGVGQDTVSRLERRGDMLLSTLRQYVESMGGTLHLVVHMPGEPPVFIDPLRGNAGQQPGTAAQSATGGLGSRKS
ncbi:MAG: helix-turn-helix domain-containing protein [Rhodocyclaceae bacterium]|nr:helix-turn-helix domain-containing protein [Rhodocyclaceae bacterium]